MLYHDCEKVFGLLGESFVHKNHIVWARTREEDSIVMRVARFTTWMNKTAEKVMKAADRLQLATAAMGGVFSVDFSGCFGMFLSASYFKLLMRRLSRSDCSSR